MNEKSTRYFISISDAKKIFIKDFTLYDNEFVIKSKNDGETVALEPILTIGSFKKTSVDEYAGYCNSKHKELLYEVDPAIVANVDFTKIEIRTFHLLENGKYYEEQPDFEPRFLQLLEYDLIRKLNKKNYNVISILPSSVDRESLFLSEKSILIIGDSFSERRDALFESRLGCDYYLLPQTSEMLELYPTWVVELEEVSKNVFKMRKRNYFFIKLLTKEELSDLNPVESSMYQIITKNKKSILMDIDNNKILENDETVSWQELYKISRLDLEVLLTRGINNLSLKDYIYVYQQQEMDLIPISVEEALNIQRKKTL